MRRGFPEHFFELRPVTLEQGEDYHPLLFYFRKHFLIYYFIIYVRKTSLLTISQNTPFLCIVRVVLEIFRNGVAGVLYKKRTHISANFIWYHTFDCGAVARCAVACTSQDNKPSRVVYRTLFICHHFLSLRHCAVFWILFHCGIFVWNRIYLFLRPVWSVYVFHFTSRQNRIRKRNIF